MAGQAAAAVHSPTIAANLALKPRADPFYARPETVNVGKNGKACRHNPVSESFLSFASSGANAGLGSRETSVRQRSCMCVYLAPRWRRRSTATLLLALALLLLTVDATRALRSQEAGNSGSRSVTVVDEEAGVVTTDTKQSATTVTTRAWNTGSIDASQLVDEKTISFNSLVKTTSAPSTERSTESASASSAMDNEVITPETSSASGDTSSLSSATQGGDVDGGSFDSDDSSSDSKSTNDKTTGATNKATTSATPAPTPAPTLAPTSAPVKATHAPPRRPGSFDARARSTSASGSGEQSVTGQSYEQSSSINSAEALENKTKAAASSTSSRSLDQTLVVVIVGVVGAIGALLMFVSRKVLKETGDDKDLEDSSIF